MSVDAVVVNYNSGRFVFDCLASLKAQTRPLHRIWVVDNASRDGSLERLRTIDGIELIENPSNAGFAVANNQAIREAVGHHILCCNPDVVVARDFLERCLPVFDCDPLVGMVTGKILRFDHRTIDSTGQFLSSSRWPCERGYGKCDEGQYDRDEYVFSACGACVLYRREMVQRVRDKGDFFDPEFFTFYEDLDVGWRAHRAGWRAYYVHDARAYHYRGGSSGSGRFAFTRKSPIVRFHILKNRYLTIMKNDRPAAFVQHLPAILARDVALLGYTTLTSPSVLWRLARFLLEKGVEAVSRRPPRVR
ncbi:MAG: glycosyltransferase family 2 protein [Acidobacteria bacterium]|nr:glycosyltransferase family 2 protein [Acidobacteriota bacterium]